MGGGGGEGKGRAPLPGPYTHGPAGTHAHSSDVGHRGTYQRQPRAPWWQGLCSPAQQGWRSSSEGSKVCAFGVGGWGSRETRYASSCTAGKAGATARRHTTGCMDHTPTAQQRSG